MNFYYYYFFYLDGKPDTASSAMDTSSIPISSTSSTTLPAVATKLEGSLPFTFSSAPSNASLLNTIVFRRHPLHVSIKINTKVFGAIVIDFYYLVYLNIVTCRCVLEIGSRKEVKPHYNELLSNLFTSDQGKVSPNAAVQHLLDRLQITTPFEQLLDPSEYVYKWTQWICGMDFPTSAVLQLPANASLENISYDSLSLLEYQPDLLGNPVAASEISSRRHLPAILLAIQQRVVSRVQLGTQFNNFDVGKTLDVSAVVFPTLLQEAVPKLKSWENVDAASYKAMRSKFFEAVNKNNANNSNSSEASSEASTDAMSMSDTDNNTDNINNTNTNKEDDADGSTKRSSTPLNDLNLNEEIDDSNDILLYFLCTIQGPESKC